MKRSRWSRLPGVLFLACALWALSGTALAQMQRSFINQSFEIPALAPNACWRILPSSAVQGWETSHPPGDIAGTCTSPAFTNGVSDPSPIELWRNFNGVPPVQGLNHAELNAHASSRLYQSVCMVPGERVRWSLAHRGRSGNDVMSFNIGPNADGSGAVEIVQAQSSTTGAGASQVCGASSTCNAPTTQGTWSRYSGEFVWAGAGGLQTVGFEAISAAGGVTQGNFLDDIHFILLPFVEFVAANLNTREGDSAQVPRVRVMGVAEAPFDIVINVTGGTAVHGVDYSGPAGASFAVTIPAGDYGTGREFELGLDSIDDDIIEDNKTLALSIVPSAADFNIASTETCGFSGQGTLLWTIVDDDVDLAVTKSVNNATPAQGETFEYTVEYSNNTARPSIAPLDAHDVMATLLDTPPAGVVFGNWTCAASGGAACPAAAGAGALNLSAMLPAGNGAAGGMLTYVIEATLDADCATDVTNTATIAVPAQRQEGSAVAPGFVSPAAGGTANNSATADVAQRCPALGLVKQVNPTAATMGDTVVYTLQVSNTGLAPADGAVVTDPGVPGSLTCSSLDCSVTAGAAACPDGVSPGQALTPAQLVAGMTIPILPAGAAIEIELTCTVTATGAP